MEFKRYTFNFDEFDSIILQLAEDIKNGYTMWFITEYPYAVDMRNLEITLKYKGNNT